MTRVTTDHRASSGRTCFKFTGNWYPQVRINLPVTNMSKEKYDLFISHNSLDKPLIDPLVEKLYDGYDIRCWLDKWDLAAAEDWAQRINQALQSCAACAVMLGANGWGPHHLEEAKMALRLKAERDDFRVIPILLPGANAKDIAVLGDFFQRIHRVDFSNGIDDSEAFRRLLASTQGEAPGPPPMTVFSIRRDAERWKQTPNKDKNSVLYSGGELREAQKLAQDHASGLTDLAVRFLSASAAEEQRQIMAERKRTRRIISSLVAALVIFIGLGLFAWSRSVLAESRRQEAVAQKQEADTQRAKAEESAREALRQKAIAEENFKTAQENEREAKKQKEQADKNAEQARLQESIAKENARKEREARLREEEAKLAETGGRATILAQLPGHDVEALGVGVQGLGLSRKPYRAPAVQSVNGLASAVAASEFSVALQGHWEGVTSAAFSPDDALVLTGGNDGTARLWDALTGRPLKVFAEDTQTAGYTQPITDVGFSPKGRFVITKSADNTVQLWDQSTGQRLHKLTRHILYRSLPTFSPDESVAVTIDYETPGSPDLERIGLWDTSTGKLIREIRQAYFTDSPLSFSPDGTRFVVGGKDVPAIVVDAHTGATLQTLGGHSSPVYAAGFSPDGKYIVTGSPCDTRTWDARTYAHLADIPGDGLGCPINPKLSFAPDGESFLWEAQRQVRIWQTRTGALLKELPGRSKEGGGSAAFISGGSRVIAYYGGGIRVWDAATGKVLLDVNKTFSYRILTEGPRLLGADKRVGVLGSDNNVQILDAGNGGVLAQLNGFGDQIMAVAYSSDGSRVVTVNQNLPPRLWLPWMDKSYGTLRGHSQQLQAAAFSPDGLRIATASFDHTARVWDARTGELLKTLDEGSRNVWWVDFSGDGKRIVTAGEDDKIRVWDTESGDVVCRIPLGFNSELRPVLSFKGDEVIAADGLNQVHLWDVPSGAETKTVPGGQGRILLATFIRGRAVMFTVGQNHVITTQDVRQGTIISSMAGHPKDIYAAALSRDGERLATAGEDNTVRTWEVKTGRPLAVVPQTHNWHSVPALSSDGSRLVTLSNDGTIHIWAADTGAPSITFRSPHYRDAFAAFSPDGGRVLTWNRDETAARIYPTTLEGFYLIATKLLRYQPEFRQLRQHSAEQVGGSN